MQRNAFKEELKMLNKKGFVDRGKCKKLRLFLDNNGIIRFEARIQYSLIKDPKKSPILMDTQSEFTKSYIKNIHVHNNCGAKNFTLNSARQEIHAIKLTTLVTSIIGKCNVCMRYRLVLSRSIVYDRKHASITLFWPDRDKS